MTIWTIIVPSDTAECGRIETYLQDFVAMGHAVSELQIVLRQETETWNENAEKNNSWTLLNLVFHHINAVQQLQTVQEPQNVFIFWSISLYSLI